MNKQIKEMSKQAHSVADATYAEGPDEIWLKEYNKKFAELIIQECADIAKHHVMNISNYADAEFVEKQIETHFGVEL